MRPKPGGSKQFKGLTTAERFRSVLTARFESHGPGKIHNHSAMAERPPDRLWARKRS